MICQTTAHVEAWCPTSAPGSLSKGEQVSWPWLVGSGAHRSEGIEGTGRSRFQRPLRGNLPHSWR